MDHKPKILVIGGATWGKDSVGKILEDLYGLRFLASSSFATDRIMVPYFESIGKAYPSAEACFDDRVNNRATWYQQIEAYNEPTWNRVTREMFADGYSVYVGMRSPREFEASRHLFDYVFWVDASKRIPPEDVSSNGMTPDMADYIIDNNGPESRLIPNVKATMDHLSKVLARRNILIPILREALMNVRLNTQGQRLSEALLDGLDGDVEYQRDVWSGTFYQAIDRLCVSAIHTLVEYPQKPIVVDWDQNASYHFTSDNQVIEVNVIDYDETTREVNGDHHAQNEVILIEGKVLDVDMDSGWYLIVEIPGDTLVNVAIPKTFDDRVDDIMNLFDKSAAFEVIVQKDYTLALKSYTVGEPS